MTLSRAPRDADELMTRVEEAARAVTPGGVLAVGDGGRPVLARAFGVTQTEGGPAEVVTLRTRYDLASVTKPIVTGVLMRLVADGVIDVDAPARRWLPELGPEADAIRIRHLVGHASGLPAHVKFYERIWAGDLAGANNPRDALLAMVATTAPERRPGEEAVYSDVGFIALGFALERATGRRLDELVAAHVTGPLGMESCGFVDLLADPPAPRPAPVAPTEICARRGLVRGEVHDENCHAAGGITAHAGLFGTADDLARFAEAMIAARAGNARTGFAPAVVRYFFTTAAAPATCKRLGWETPAPLPTPSHAGDRWPRDGVGHLGFTGTSIWLDPPRGRYVVLLTNRVHPTRHREGILGLRRTTMDAVVAMLEG